MLVIPAGSLNILLLDAYMLVRHNRLFKFGCSFGPQHVGWMPGSDRRPRKVAPSTPWSTLESHRRTTWSGWQICTHHPYYTCLPLLALTSVGGGSCGHQSLSPFFCFGILVTDITPSGFGCCFDNDLEV